jgi:hypothetical protein
MDEKELKSFLEGACSCTWLGRPLPRPYCEDDELLPICRNEDGHHFSVPLPDLSGGKYSQALIDKIVEVNTLAVKPRLVTKKNSAE